jgi:hypothetical protein
MKKLTYRLTTLSSLIVSPRANLAWYDQLNDFFLPGIKEGEHLSKDKLKVIYPFYQYGEYREYAPNFEKYYLPGSSIKGALCGNNSISGGCMVMVDDIPVCNTSIVLRNLYKAQYLKEEQQARFDVFFENVGVEMIKASTELNGELYLNDAITYEFFNEARISTKTKMEQMLKYLRILEKKNCDKKLLSVLTEAYSNLSALLKTENIYLLGGYKGLLHSMALEPMALENVLQGFSSAIFLDPETMLPHGLIKVEFVKE